MEKNVFKPLILLLLLASAFTDCAAQDIFQFEAAKHITGKSWFNHIKVIDNRTDKKDIGYTRNGAFNAKHQLVTALPLNEELATFVNDKLDSADKGDGQLLVVLNDFMIEDRPTGDELGTFYLNCYFFSGHDDQYRYAGTIDQITECASKWDVTKKLIKRIQYEVWNIFQSLANDTPLHFSEQIYTEAQARDFMNLEHEAYPIYKTEIFKKGVYFTMEDFLNHHPCDTPFVERVFQTDGGSSHYFYYENKKGKKGDKIKKAFAIYNGKDWYTSDVDRAVKMKFEYGNFYTRKYFSGLKADNTTAVMGAMFGVVGALATMGTSAAHDSKNCYYEARLNPAEKKFYPVKRLW